MSIDDRLALALCHLGLAHDVSVCAEHQLLEVLAELLCLLVLLERCSCLVFHAMVGTLIYLIKVESKAFEVKKLGRLVLHLRRRFKKWLVQACTEIHLPKHGALISEPELWLSIHLTSEK